MISCTEKDWFLINGTATGEKVFNAGMRGKKGSEYDGGHRVPFIAHWPAAGWNRRHSSDMLCHAVDAVPTLVALAGGTKPAELIWDGNPSACCSIR